MFGDWTHEEYLKILGVDLSKAPDNTVGTYKRSKRQTRAVDSVDCPDEKDWRKEGAVTRVKDQRNCSSCWAFAGKLFLRKYYRASFSLYSNLTAVGAMESHFFLQRHELLTFSEQQFVDCSVNSGNGCEKNFMQTAYEFSKKNGLITADKYPYTGAESGANNSCSNHPSDWKISDFKTITKGSEEDLKDAICRFGPVSVAFDASSEEFMHYHAGIFMDPDCSTTKTTHGALVVGYGLDEFTGDKYWLVKNSYSDSWGENGYVRILRDFHNHCGIANFASIPVPIDRQNESINTISGEAVGWFLNNRITLLQVPMIKPILRQRF